LCDVLNALNALHGPRQRQSPVLWHASHELMPF
jgi:hypothetical protein